MNLLKNLNPEQLAAVEHKDGPLLIVAGAGTGKTTVIAQRIAYLIERGLAGPEEILALTFTEKAAGEMADRVGALLPYGYFDLWISTFHSFSERILKEHGLAIGLSTDFKLLNEFEQWALIKKNLDKFELDYYRPLGHQTKFIRALIKHFSRAKDEDISPLDYLAYAEELKQNFDQMLGGSAKCQISPLRLCFGGQANNKCQKDKKSKLSVIPASEPESSLERSEQVSGSRVKPGMTNFSEEIAEQEEARLNEIANAYHVYEQLLLDNNVLDFGDLINYSLKLFRGRPAILEKYRQQFKYILLDEFQDTNWSQYELIKILAGASANLTVVGDDDQSIFRFRGASMSNILQFNKDYPAAKKIILTRNYRSEQNILDLSYEFIKQNNPNRLEWQLNSSVILERSAFSPGLNPGEAIGSRGKRNNTDEMLSLRSAPLQHDKVNKLNKKLIAENKGQGEIKIIEGADLAEEVKSVADKIVELKNKDKAASWNDFAILVRANDSAYAFMDELDRRGLPYIFGARRGLYSKPLILDVVAYFKLLDNYHESVSLWRVLNLPVYNFTAEELVNFNHLARKKAWSLYEVIKQSATLLISPETQKKINPLLALIAKHSALAREKTASEILLAFLNDSGYLKYLMSLAERENLETMSLLNQFLKRIRDFEAAGADKSLKNFLAELSLEMESGEEGGLAADLESGPEAIKILTVHAAKGLEFKYVFIANLVDKRFPTIERSEPIPLPEALVKEILPEGDAHLEEERRLFYVAMTRAKHGLYFSLAGDYGGKIKKKASRFLVELGLCGKTSPLNKEGKPPLLTKEGNKGRLIISAKAPPLSLPLSKGENNKPNVRGDDTTPLHPPLSGGKMPAPFSYSQLAAYSNCPYQYRFAHILKIPVMGKEQFSFGKTMHATLQKLFTLVNEKKGLGQGDLFGASNLAPLNKGDEGGLKPPALKSPLPPFVKGGNSRITFDEVLKLYEQSWIDDWYESKEKKQERKKQGREILKVFYEKYNGHWPEVLFLEKSFNLKIADGQNVYTVRGTIDRIDQAPSTGSGQAVGLKLVDYKTGRAKQKLTFAEKEQLFIYQLAAQELFKQPASLASPSLRRSGPSLGGPVSGLVFYYLDDNSQAEFIGRPEDLIKIKAKIISTIKEIGRGEFPPHPNQLCAWCDFNGICEFKV